MRADDPERSPLHAMCVVVLDEAGMVSTRDLAQLARHSEEAGAKLVLVGDHAQLAKIAAGGSFGVLAERLGALELSENRRHELGWERRALVDVREGKPPRRWRPMPRTGASMSPRICLEPSGPWWPTGWRRIAKASRP